MEKMVFGFSGFSPMKTFGMFQYLWDFLYFSWGGGGQGGEGDGIGC